LQRRAWIPLAELVELPEQSEVQTNRETAGMFYSESWALADMLVLSPDYGLRFGALLAALTVGTPSDRALAEVYGRPLDAIAKDLRAWAEKKHAQVPLPGFKMGEAGVGAPADVSPRAARAMLADLLSAAGELERARAIYLELEWEAPDAAVFAALGNISLRAGDKDRARQEWKRAIAKGINDPKLCYQYAVLAENAGLPDSDFRAALERAVALKPEFDDARYMLALVQKNAGEYDAAVGQLRAMRHVVPVRAFHYWMALANALVELDRREEAVEASKHAVEHASNAAERSSAEQVAYMAQTDLAVQFTNGANGRVEMQTTRVPHKTSDFNPFVEPGDDMRHVEGRLREIECTGDTTRFVVETSGKRLTLAVVDRSRVEMRNAPPEFTCGPQAGVKVAVDYAASSTGKAAVNAAGVVRRMEFQ
jgi:tetratricopeptide (TPR) repeat protein